MCLEGFAALFMSAWGAFSDATDTHTTRNAALMRFCPAACGAELEENGVKRGEKRAKRSGNDIAYTEFVQERRRCTRLVRETGDECQAYAVWGDPEGRCSPHGGRIPRDAYGRPVREHVPPCDCPAYAWPHRPGGGLCQWPHLPGRRSTTPLGTRSWRHTARRQSRRYRRYSRQERAVWQELRDLRQAQRDLRRRCRQEGIGAILREIESCQSSV
jgi:hypothetical protein